ncbi:MAG: hypothetical protein R3F11_23720 [Verrucomicrobiales bacterium]
MARGALRGSMAGLFCWSVCMTDLHTGWTEVRASLGRGDRAVHGALRRCARALPFALRGYHSDNGGEVLSRRHRWLSGMDPPVEQTRSRPYRKNDNAHAEQKNRTRVRALLGHGRIGGAGLAAALDRLLARWSLWNNLYSPTLRLLSKERLPGGRVRKPGEGRSPRRAGGGGAAGDGATARARSGPRARPDRGGPAPHLRQPPPPSSPPVRDARRPSPVAVARRPSPSPVARRRRPSPGGKARGAAASAGGGYARYGSRRPSRGTTPQSTNIRQQQPQPMPLRCPFWMKRPNLRLQSFGVLF